MNKQIEQGRSDGTVESKVPAQPGISTVAIPLVSGEELLARTQPLPKWIDDMKGSGPTTDSLIAYIEQLRAGPPVQQPAPGAVVVVKDFDIEDAQVLFSAAENMRSADKYGPVVDARYRIAYKVEQIAKRMFAQPSPGAQPVQQPAPVASDERAAFESLCRNNAGAAAPLQRLESGAYCNYSIQAQWVGWEARSAIAQRSAVVAAQVAGQEPLLVQALKDIAEACNCCGDRHDLAQIAQDALDALIGDYELTKETQFKMMNHRLKKIFAVHSANGAQAGELSDAGTAALVLEQAAQACDQQADGTNGPYRTACLQCANAVRELRDAAASKGGA